MFDSKKAKSESKRPEPKKVNDMDPGRPSAKAAAEAKFAPRPLSAPAPIAPVGRPGVPPPEIKSLSPKEPAGQWIKTTNSKVIYKCGQVGAARNVAYEDGRIISGEVRADIAVKWMK